jgi:hypothetical protein
VVCWSISIKLWWYGGVFTLNFGCMLEYFHLTLVVCWSISIKLWWFGGVFQLHFGQSLIEILQHTTKVKWKYSNIQPKFNVNTPPNHQSLMEILQHTTKD